LDRYDRKDVLDKPREMLNFNDSNFLSFVLWFLIKRPLGWRKIEIKSMVYFLGKLPDTIEYQLAE
jgi:hypothetical protein